MASRVDILSQFVPIVDDQGRPTTEFMLQWEQKNRVLLTIPDVSTAAAISALLDLIGSTEGDILVRGGSEWERLAYSGNVNTFLNGNGAYTQVSESGLNLSDVSTANATTSRHGFLPKLDGSSTKFLAGDGSWQTPASGSSNERTHSVPAASGFTLLNANSFTLTDGTYSMLMDSVGTTGGITIASQTPPSTPYDIIMRAEPLFTPLTNGYHCGVALRNSSSGRIIIAGFYQSNKALVQNWTNYTTYNSDILSPTGALAGDYFPWTRVENDGTNLNFYCSVDGDNWIQYATTTLAAYISSVDQIGPAIFINGNRIITAYQSFEAA